MAHDGLRAVDVFTVPEDGGRLEFAALENAIEESKMPKKDTRLILARAGDTARRENAAFRWKSSNPGKL
jgi:hypothetical protein